VFWLGIFCSALQYVAELGKTKKIKKEMVMEMVYCLLFHMTQPISRSTIKAIACSKPTISENRANENTMAQ